MFNMIKKLFAKTSKEDIIKILKTNPQYLKEFEESYKKYRQDFSVSNGSEKLDIIAEKIVDKIVDELVSLTPVYSYDGEKLERNLPSKPLKNVSMKEIYDLPLGVRPYLTGYYYSVDIKEPSSYAILDAFKRWQDTGNRNWYHRFRQGLDILDLDEITYKIIDTNPNSMGFWLPKLVDGKGGFFKIPKTKIIKVPMPLLQLTRKDYELLNRTTLEIVDKFCQKVFELDFSKEYFVKTGTYSSKFDFRNCHIVGEKEVQELGEYLLYIHYQALCMAHSTNKVSCYGVSTTTEWCVREFIEDKDGNPTIYNGLPLHTEYRVFVDFDTDTVLGIHNYWDEKVMKDRFTNYADSEDVQNKHDYVTFFLCEEKLLKSYNKNKDLVLAEIGKIVSNIDLKGQWSIDIMQNGEDFWIIDMALAENSAYYKEVVPENLRKPLSENWIPELA